MGESQDVVVPTAADEAPLEEDAVVGGEDASDDIALITAALDAEDADAPESTADVPSTPAEPVVVAAESAPSDPAAESVAEPVDAAALDIAAEPTETPADDDADFDAIPVTAPPHAQPDLVPDTRGALSSVPWWPFLAYLGAWVVLAGVAVWQLLQLPAAQVAYESTTYALMILGGLVMTAVGPLLILAVWLATRAARPAQERAGLLTSSLIKGALVTLSGAVVWWAALVIVDYLRLGTPL